MFEYMGKKYELVFNIGRLKFVEKQLKSSIVAEIMAGGGALSLLAMESCFGYCLKEVGANDFIPQEKAVKIGEGLIEEKGYIFVNNEIFNKLNKDMPFLFRTA